MTTYKYINLPIFTDLIFLLNLGGVPILSTEVEGEACH